jgi:hypothetical protein
VSEQLHSPPYNDPDPDAECGGGCRSGAADFSL